MPRTGLSIIYQRLSFITACLLREQTMSHLCLDHGISGRTSYNGSIVPMKPAPRVWLI
jgi:hypothetical protein